MLRFLTQLPWCCSNLSSPGLCSILRTWQELVFHCTVCSTSLGLQRRKHVSKERQQMTKQQQRLSCLDRIQLYRNDVSSIVKVILTALSQRQHQHQQQNRDKHDVFYHLSLALLQLWIRIISVSWCGVSVSVWWSLNAVWKGEDSTAGNAGLTPSKVK